MRRGAKRVSTPPKGRGMLDGGEDKGSTYISTRTSYGSGSFTGNVAPFGVA